MEYTVATLYLMKMLSKHNLTESLKTTPSYQAGLRHC